MYQLFVYILINGSFGALEILNVKGVIRLPFNAIYL